MALNSDVQPPALPGGQAPQLGLGAPHLGQHLARQRQHPATGGGETDRPGAPHDQRHPQPVLQVLELVGQRRLGDVQALGGLHQAAGLVDGLQGGQVAEFKH